MGSYPVSARVPQGSVLGSILWSVYFGELLRSIAAASAYADDCTLTHSYAREETADTIDATNR